MKDGRFEDAVRDYGAAYERSKDPALLWKLGRAHERAGRCDVALTYYARYLAEGKPSEPFTRATQERIAACGGKVPGPQASTTPAEPRLGAGSAPGHDTGSAPGHDTGSAPGHDTGRATSGKSTPVAAGSAPPAPAPAGPASVAGAGRDTGSAAQNAEVPAAGSAEVPAGPASGSAMAALTPSHGHKVGWLLTGSALALATLGGVLGYAANSSENDVRDLYVGFAGRPRTFDARTRQDYDDLVAQGRRYERLSWASFGLAGAAAAGAAVLFVLGDRNEASPDARPEARPEARPDARPARVTPIVTPTGAGLAVRY